MKIKFGIVFSIALFLFITCFAKKKIVSKQKEVWGEYRLVSILDNNKQQVVGYNGTKITLSKEKQTLWAYVGCNSIMAKVMVQQNQIHLDNLTTTEMACPDGIDGLEAKFKQYLQDITAVQTTNQGINLLNNKKIILVLKRK